MLEYKVVRERPHELGRAVNELIHEGWTPLGGVAAHGQDAGVICELAQAMIRKRPADTAKKQTKGQP